MSKEKVKVALIGPGRWGKNILSVLDTIAEVAWVGHHGSDSTTQYLRENYPDIKHSNDLTVIFNDKSIEAVFVASPVQTHVELAKRVLSAEKHAFVEKPLALNSKDVEMLYELAAQAGSVLFTGYIFNYHPIGRFLLARARSSERVSLYQHLEKLGTFDSPLVENFLVHDVAFARAALGNIQKLEIGEQTGELAEHVAQLSFVHEKGTAFAEINRLSPAKNRTVIMGADGHVYIWQNESLYELVGKSLRALSIDAKHNSPLEAEIEEFFSCLGHNSGQGLRKDIDLAVAFALEELSLHDRR